VSEIFALAVVSALDAGLLAAAVVLLGQPRPAQKLLAYLIGGMGCSILFGLLIVFALHGSGLLRGPDRATSAIIELAAGTLLIAIAIAVRSGRAAQWRPRPRRRDGPAAQDPYDRAVGGDSLWIAWVAGAAYGVPGAYYLAAMALLAKLDASAETNVLVIVGFNLIMFALIELPLVGLLVAPDRTRSAAENLNGWMTRHRQTLIAFTAAAVGIYLFVSGLSDLR
jgi:Sap-like sulfolipid-1-addressing protein